MLPKELDGVVDPKLIVYGTSNLRVVDISVMPFVSHTSLPAHPSLTHSPVQMIGSHLMGTAYVIGEKAADMIKTAHRVNADEPEIMPQVPLEALDAIQSVREQASEAMAAAKLRVAHSLQIPLGEFSRSTQEL